MDTYSPAADNIATALTAVSGLFVCITIFGLAILVIIVWLFYRIFEKAGYNGWMGLLSLIPSLGLLICLCILAFDKWPAQRAEAANPGGSAPTPVPTSYVPAPVAPVTESPSPFVPTPITPVTTSAPESEAEPSTDAK
jgi:hypothetical protein